MNYDAALEQAQDDVERRFNEYDRCLRDHADKKAAVKKAEAIAFLRSQGTVDQRKATVTYETADLLAEYLNAEALEKSAKSALEVARDRVSVLQTRSKLNQPLNF
jgi:hypothetical protein